MRYKVSRQFFVDLSGKVSLFGKAVFTLEGDQPLLRSDKKKKKDGSGKRKKN